MNEEQVPHTHTHAHTRTRTRTHVCCCNLTQQHCTHKYILTTLIAIRKRVARVDALGVPKDCMSLDLGLDLVCNQEIISTLGNANGV